MLSLALAIAAGEAPSGGRRSIGSANGTRTRSVSAPPHAPPAGPIPYIEPRGLTSRQFPVRPRRHASHAPHEIWDGTTAASPGDPPSSAGSGTSRHATFPGSMKVSSRMARPAPYWVSGHSDGRQVLVHRGEDLG